LEYKPLSKTILKSIQKEKKKDTSFTGFPLETSSIDAIENFSTRSNFFLRKKNNPSNFGKQ